MLDRLPRAGPGKVPVQVASAGTQQVLTVPAANGYLRRTVLLGTPVCATPCTLYAPPGSLVLHTNGPGSIAGTFDLQVPATGTRVLLRRSSAARTIAGSLLTGIGIATLLSGVVSLGISTEGSDQAHANLRTPGAVLTGTGVAALVPGIVLLSLFRPGIASQRPLSP